MEKLYTQLSQKQEFSSASRKYSNREIHKLWDDILKFARKKVENHLKMTVYPLVNGEKESKLKHGKNYSNMKMIVTYKCQ